MSRVRSEGARSALASIKNNVGEADLDAVFRRRARLTVCNKVMLGYEISLSLPGQAARVQIPENRHLRHDGIEIHGAEGGECDAGSY